MRVRNAVFVAVLLAAVAAHADDWTKNYQVGASPSLTVRTNDARVTVRARGGNSIEARVTTTGYRIGPDDVRVTERQSGDNVSIDVRIPNQHGLFFGARNVQIEVSVPPATKLDVSSSDGSLHVFDVKAAAVLRTSDGSIEVFGHDGSLDAHTSDGSIRASGRFDQLQLVTSDGHIECTAAPGSKINSGWNLRTSDGSVQLRIPNDIAAEVDLSTSDGHVSSDLPVTVTGQQSRTHLHGTINGGGPRIAVRTADGSITLARS